MNQVKIYGTLGPACASVETLSKMLEAGMDGIRLNLSHAALSDSSEWIAAYHKASDACGKAAELLIDMQGPELRIGALKKPLLLEDGGTVPFESIPFPEAVKPYLTEGQQVLLDDGKLLLKVYNGVLTVLRGGLLESRKSVALPGCSVDTPAMTETDRRNLSEAVRFGVTGVMQPFVRSREDLLAVRSALDQAGGRHIRLFAKIENRDGLAHLGELLPHCDEVVIARGDLGNAVPLWTLPAAQKRIASACREANRDFTVVTQMLDSMIRRPVPTRAEVSDVFNAVLDGASSVMLTGETAVGAYPVEAIRYLVKTVREAERYLETAL